MDGVEIKIEGMTCPHCVASVSKALTAVNGVEKAEVSLAGKNALVWGSASRSDMIAAIEKIGFSAS